MKKYLVMASLLSCGISVLLLGALWEMRWQPRALLSKTRFGNMPKISWGIMRFETKTGRLPTNLQEVVMQGSLPRYSRIYSCPMMRHSLLDRCLSYDAAEYEFDFRTNVVVIAVPPAVFHAERYVFARRDLRELRIEQGACRDISDGIR